MPRTNFPTTTGNPKYKSAAHRRERARWQRLMQQQGYLTCSQPECVMASRTINLDDAWHLGHDDTGTTYIGPTHATCNVRDGARRGRARQGGTRVQAPTRWAL